MCGFLSDFLFRVFHSESLIKLCMEKNVFHSFCEVEGARGSIELIYEVVFLRVRNAVKLKVFS